MKRVFLVLLLMVFSAPILFADYFSFQPYTITQPDGIKINCFVSGDEFYNWLHDKDGYTIIQADDGYFYYGEIKGDEVGPSAFRVNEVNPEQAGLHKWVKISNQAYQRIREKYYEGYTKAAKSPTSDTLNNLVVYIKFSDDTEFTDSRQYFDDKFNLISGISLKSYYQEVSYSHLTISSTHYPVCAMTTNYSYTDSHPRSYFQPYNATTNPNGYSNESQRTFREHTLLRDAMAWIDSVSPVSPSLNIDGDNDGYVDNICFNVRGGNGAWASLLWAHSWVLYSYNVTINGKRVWEYTFQPETQLNVKTICHEMFHSMGAPDLYHYSYDGLQPVQNWDLMESGFGHMGAYMKWKYANHDWISSIPEINTSGTYTLNPLSSSTNNCYKIASPNSTTEYFILEYRKASGMYEGSLPGSGLLVYRIDPNYSGNAYGPPDEVYIYRMNGTTSSNGSPSSAFFSLASGRIVINDATNPSSFLQNGTPGGLSIYNIGSAGTTITFSVGINTIATPSAISATPVSPTQINLEWTKNNNNDNVMLVWNTYPVFGNPVSGTAYSPGNTISGGGTVLYVGPANSFQHTGLYSSTDYYYKIFSVTSSNTYSYGITQSAKTLCESITLPYSQSFQGEVLPACWSTQSAGAGTINGWSLVQSTHAGGSPFEMRSVQQFVNSGTNRLIMPPVNTTGMVQISLSFRHFLDCNSTGTTFKIQSSTDKINWTDEEWSIQATAGNIGPEIVSTAVNFNLNSPHTYISFTVDGNLYQYNYWYLDNVTLAAVPAKSLNLSLLLEGLFNGLDMNKAMNESGYQFPDPYADQFTVELHAPVSPYGLIGAPYPAFLRTDGTSTVSIPSAYTGSYYIVVKHRNSLETWSATPVSLVNSVTNYSFSNSASQAFGGNQKLVSGKWVIYSGDINQDGLVDSGDMVILDNSILNFEAGYTLTDLNGDGLADSSDFILLENNSSVFAGSITP